MRKYLTSESNVSDPHCMGCRIAWSHGVVYEAVGKSFSTKNMVQHRKKILVDRSRARIPQIQEFAIARRDLPRLQHERNREIAKIEAEISDIRREKMAALDSKRNEIRAMETIVYGRSSERNTQRRNVFVHKCSGQNCEGFLSSQWKCGVCETYTCKDCGVNIGTTEEKEQHQCNENDIASFAIVKKECKPCPNCASQIHKIEGCDQMWCTQCQTPFSWRTGEKINGTIHNPHYFEWARRRGNLPRQPGDVVCGGNVDSTRMRHELKGIFLYFQMVGTDINIAERRGGRPGADEIIKRMFDFLIMRKAHYEEVSLPSLRPSQNRKEHEDKCLLSDFIVKNISEEELGYKLAIIDKRRRFNVEFSDIMQTYITVSEDSFRNIVNTSVEAKREVEEAPRLGITRDSRDRLQCLVFKTFSELTELNRYLIEQLANLTKNYNYCTSAFSMELKEQQYRISWTVKNCGYPKPDSWVDTWPIENLEEIETTYIPPNMFRDYRRRY